MTAVRVENLTKAFGKTVAVDSVSLDIADGQLATLLGPSGCGKSTMLRCIAGLAEADAGNIYFGDRLVNDVPTARRRIGFLFQRLALFPHMRVFDNVAFGLRMQRRPKDEIARRVTRGPGPGSAARVRGAIPPAAVGRSAAACGARPDHHHRPGHPAV